MSWLDWIIPQLEFSTVFLFVAVLVLATIIKSWIDQPKNLPPFPATPYPIVGNALQMKNPRDAVNKWAKQMNGIFCAKLGTHLVVFLTTYDLIKEAFVKQADAYSDKPMTILMKCKGYKIGSGIIGASGAVWKVQRSVTQSILRQFGMGKNFLALKIQEEVNRYLNELAKYKGEPREVRRLTNNSASNNICSIVLGRRFEYDDPQFAELMGLMDEFFTLFGKANAFYANKYLQYLPGDPFQIKRLLHMDSRVSKEVVYAHIEKEQPRVNSADEADNYILAFLREMKRKQQTGQDLHMDELNLKYNIYGLFLAGTDTTSTTLIWFMLYMIHYPEIQEKIYKEIVDVIGLNKSPDMSHKPEMNYLNAAIFETLRAASILPFSIMHETAAETTIAGYTIPKGTRIIPHLDSVLWDEKIWKNPKDFNPENFLDKNGQLHIPEQFIPFSIGRRVCVGEPLAKMELFLYVAGLLQRFELKPADPNNLPPLSGHFSLTCPPSPYALRFIERNV